MGHTLLGKSLSSQSAPASFLLPVPSCPWDPGLSGQVVITSSPNPGNAAWSSAASHLYTSYLGPTALLPSKDISGGAVADGAPQMLTPLCTASGWTVPSTWTGQSPKSGRKPLAGVKEQESCLQKPALIPPCPAASLFQGSGEVKGQGLSQLCHM